MRSPLVAILLVWSASAMAQDRVPPATDPVPRSQTTENPPPPRDGSDSDLTVVKPRLPDKKEVRALARAITPRVPFNEPLARFSDPVCFVTVGLPIPTLEAIGDRLAMAAELAGIPLAGAGCAPNIAIFFIDHSDETRRRLAKRRAYFFGDRMPSEIRRLQNEPGPIHAWSNSEIRSRDGDRIDPDGRLKVPQASRIGVAVRRDMLASIVLVERSAVTGMNVHQIADYLAMRTLAVVQPLGTSGKDTILSLFDKSHAAPLEMTAFDRSYLKSLYSTAATLPATASIGKVARDVIKDAQARIAAPTAIGADQ